MASSGMLRRVALVITDVSEELRASIVRATRIGELGMLAINSNRRTLHSYIPLKCQFLQEPHGVTSHKMAIFKYILPKNNIIKDSIDVMSFCQIILCTRAQKRGAVINQSTGVWVAQLRNRALVSSSCKSFLCIDY
jgi:hypothetical protein